MGQAGRGFPLFGSSAYPHTLFFRSYPFSTYYAALSIMVLLNGMTILGPDKDNLRITELNKISRSGGKS